FSSLVHEVFMNRMGGAPLLRDEIASITRWVFALRRPPPELAGDADAAARGEILFHDPAVGCASCHAGPKLTNNSTVDVGTGGAFQVPSLIGVVTRAPYLHNGCGASLRDRFSACGGGDKHGNTSQLSAAQLDDL